MLYAIYFKHPFYLRAKVLNIFSFVMVYIVLSSFLAVVDPAVGCFYYPPSIWLSFQYRAVVPYTGKIVNMVDSKHFLGHYQIILLGDIGSNGSNSILPYEVMGCEPVISCMWNSW